MAKRDLGLRKLDKEVELATKERCRLNGERAARRMNSAEWEQATASNDKRWSDAVARRNKRMADLGLEHTPEIDSLIR